MPLRFRGSQLAESTSIPAPTHPEGDVPDSLLEQFAERTRVCNRAVLIQEHAGLLTGSQMIGGSDVEVAKEYQELVKVCWVPESVARELGEPKTIIEVNSIEDEQILDSEFGIPAGYQMALFNDLLNM